MAKRGIKREKDGQGEERRGNLSGRWGREEIGRERRREERGNGINCAQRAKERKMQFGEKKKMNG